MTYIDYLRWLCIEEHVIEEFQELQFLIKQMKRFYKTNKENSFYFNDLNKYETQIKSILCYVGLREEKYRLLGLM